MKYIFSFALFVSMSCIAMEHSEIPGKEEQQLAESAYQAFLAPVAQKNPSPHKTGVAAFVHWIFGSTSNCEEEKRAITIQAMRQELEKTRQENPDLYEQVRQRWGYMAVEHQQV